VQGETLYKWESRSGALFFSNVSPREGESDFTEILISDAPKAPESPPTDLGSGASVGDPAAPERVSPPGAVAETLAPLLTERIAEKKKEINALECLLKNRVGDDRLRGRLHCQKQYLAQYLRDLAACSR
jgi:hypothetical protein